MIEVFIWVLYAVILYVTIFTLFVFLEGGRLKQEVEWLNEWPTVTLAVPAYNEEESIGMTLDSILGLHYPEEKLEVVVVDDGSEDRTAEKVKEFTEDQRVKLVQQENQGKGAALNRALEESESKFFACVDADSRLEQDAIKNIVSNFGEDTAAIASAMKVYNPENLLQKIQWLEYIVGIFTRNVFGIMDAIYVTPGPLSVYRTEVLREVGGFDEECLVEDQEICFRLQKEQWKVKHSRKGEVYTIAPDNLKDYYHQRKRWYRGSLENMIKYRDMIMNPKYGDFGMFALPQNLATAAISIIVLFLMTYLTLKPVYALLMDFLSLGFQILPSSPPSLAQLVSTLYWSVLSTRYMTVILLGTLFFLSTVLAILSAKHTEENLLEQGFIPVLIYLAWYVIVIGIMWTVVTAEMLVDREVGW